MNFGSRDTSKRNRHNECEPDDAVSHEQRGGTAVTEREQIYLKILNFGLIRIRDAAHCGHVAYCEIEADHLHNLPSLISEPNEARRAYYLDSERTYYQERVDRSLLGLDFTLARYADVWNRLDELRIA